MKKSIVSLLLLFFTLSIFVACSSSPDDTVKLTVDWYTYRGRESIENITIPEEFGVYVGSTLITGTSCTLYIKPGTTLSEFSISFGEGPTTLPFSSYADKLVYINDQPVDINAPITKDTTVFMKDGFGCVCEGCQITLADGTTKNVEDIVLGEELLTWDFYTGSLVAKRVISIDKTSAMTRPVITITTDAGTEINIVDVQSFFDMDARHYFNISNMNYTKHIGKNIMICDDGETIKSEQIVSIVLHEETLELYDLITEDSLNFFSDNALTVVPLLFSITPYAVDDNYKYDPAGMAQDRAVYGLTSYEEFEQYASREAFEKLRLEEVRILLGKGLISQDYLTYVINKFLGSTVGIR